MNHWNNEEHFRIQFIKYMFEKKTVIGLLTGCVCWAFTRTYRKVNCSETCNTSILRREGLNCHHRTDNSLVWKLYLAIFIIKYAIFHMVKKSIDNSNLFDIYYNSSSANFLPPYRYFRFSSCWADHKRKSLLGLIVRPYVTLHFPRNMYLTDEVNIYFLIRAYSVYSKHKFFFS